MSIYKMDYKELRSKMTEFSKTIMGRITFILAYSVPIILTIILLVLISFTNMFCNLYYYHVIFIIMYSLLFSILITFILGTMYFYHGLKEYIKETSKK